MNQSTLPMIPTPSFPVEITIKNFKGGIGEAFTAELWYQGEDCALIDQSGEGGPNCYSFDDLGLSEEITEIARDWAIAAGRGEYECQSEEILDTLVEEIIMEQLLQADAEDYKHRGFSYLIEIEHLHHAEGFSPMIVRSTVATTTLDALDDVLTQNGALRYRIV